MWLFHIQNMNFGWKIALNFKRLAVVLDPATLQQLIRWAIAGSCSQAFRLQDVMWNFHKFTVSKKMSSCALICSSPLLHEPSQLNINVRWYTYQMWPSLEEFGSTENNRKIHTGNLKYYGTFSRAVVNNKIKQTKQCPFNILHTFVLLLFIVSVNCNITSITQYRILKSLKHNANRKQHYNSGETLRKNIILSGTKYSSKRPAEYGSMIFVHHTTSQKRGYLVVTWNTMGNKH